MTDQAFDYDGTIREIKKVQEKNINKVQALARQGYPLDAAQVAHLKLDTFVEMFLDRNAQAAFVLAMENKLTEALDESLAQVRQISLLADSKPSGLIVPNK